MGSLEVTRKSDLCFTVMMSKKQTHSHKNL